jgi:hypothetical protein
MIDVPDHVDHGGVQAPTEQRHQTLRRSEGEPQHQGRAQAGSGAGSDAAPERNGKNIHGQRQGKQQ